MFAIGERLAGEDERNLCQMRCSERDVHSLFWSDPRNHQREAALSVPSGKCCNPNAVFDWTQYAPIWSECRMLVARYRI
jgi:hypothetical protein